MRRALTIIYELILYPFRLIYLVLSFPVKVFLLIYQDKQSKRKKQNTKIDTLEIGQLLFQDNSKDFQTFHNLYHTNQEEFKTKYSKIFKRYDNFDVEDLQPLEILFIFGDNKQLLHLTDWRGEENLNEIDDYIEKQIKQKLDWTDTITLRTQVDEEFQTDGKFIIDLFKCVDKDLKTINQKLIFFDLNWDAYVFKTIDTLTFDKITNRASDYFHGTEKLRD